MFLKKNSLNHIMEGFSIIYVDRLKKKDMSCDTFLSMPYKKDTIIV